MHAEEYARMYELEDRYWWFVARRRLALGLLRRHLPPSGQRRPVVLDLGCGTGVVSREMGEWADTVSLDVSELALGFCRERCLPRLVRGDGTALPLRDRAVDAVLGLDIFEHIEDDQRAFEEAHRVLRPGGVLVLSVPAFRSLWGPHDVALMHFRRYRRPEAAEKLRRAGFEIEKMSYSVFFLFPIVVLVRAIEKMRRGEAKASLMAVPDSINRLLIRLQALEARLIERGRLPWGSSVVMVARKPPLDAEASVEPLPEPEAA